MDEFAQYVPGVGLLGALVGSLIFALRKTADRVLQGKLVPLEWVDKMMADQRSTIADQRVTITEQRAAAAANTETIAVLTAAVNELTAVGRTGARAYQAVAAHAEQASGRPAPAAAAWNGPTYQYPAELGGAR